MMDYALPSTWSQGSRGFWTKRKKTATSLLAVLAMIAGIAVAFKLFDQTVPNNVVRDASIFDYQVLVQRSASQGCLNPVQGGQWCDTTAGQDPIYSATRVVSGVEEPHSQYPGDTRTENVRIINANDPSRDATFLVHVENIVVEKCVDAPGSEPGTDSADFDPETGECVAGTEVVPTTDARWNRFLGFWRFSVDKEQYFQANVGPVGGEEETGDYEEACGEAGLRELTEKSPCNLGTVRGAGSETTPFGAPTDERDYRFDLHEDDDGSDQSEFRGWTVQFDFVFNAKVPADPEGSDPGTR